jgi:hypothetical protein
MARTAVNQLEQQVELIRQEAYAAGYAAAMQLIREFAGKAAPSAVVPGRRPRAGRPAAATPAPPRRPRQTRTAVAAPKRSRGGRRLQRGSNAQLVEEVLRANAPRPVRPADIRNAIQRDKGVSIAFTSIRHALGQLEARHVAEQVAATKTWRYHESAAASD